MYIIKTAEINGDIMLRLEHNYERKPLLEIDVGDFDRARRAARMIADGLRIAGVDVTDYLHTETPKR